MAKQTLETIQHVLQAEWPNIKSRDNNLGTRFTLPEGTKFNFFQSTGNIMFQGKDSDEKKCAEHLLNAAAKTLPATVAGTQHPLSLTEPEKMSVVYGHDAQAREQLECCRLLI